MPKTIIVSNRLPAEFKIQDGKITAKPSVGGLATGLKSVHLSGDSIWIGWSGLTNEATAGFDEKLTQAANRQRCAIVNLTERQVKDYYFGFSNKSLWPMFHYFLQYTTYDADQWQAYKQVNQAFADAVVHRAKAGDIVWVHDYQLLLVPQMIREKRPDLKIGFFLHIPFPSFEIIRTCPWRDEIINGLLGANLIGFHTYDYVQHFLNTVRRIAGLPIVFNEVQLPGRTVKVDSFPMGIDYKKFSDASAAPPKKKPSDLQLRIAQHRELYPVGKLILSIDRLDYTKGIPERLEAFAHFLERYPQYIGKVRLVLLAVPSREDVPQYKKLKRITDELVGRINGKFSTIDWTPIWYFYRAMPFDDLIALYSTADIALITPLRDGMNLVAKEYVATRQNQDGVLILSEMAGAANELSQAIVINPSNADDIADALAKALEMPLAEQQVRMKAMQHRVSRYTVERWAEDFMQALTSEASLMDNANSRLITPKVESVLLKEFKSAKKSLILLDYDGTLIGFRDNPEDAVPDDELLDTLDLLNARNDTEVAIISGRNKEFLSQWFGQKPYTLISDHGVWLRRQQKEWEQLEDPRADWKEQLYPVLENFTDRTPGSHIEEKQFSLAWHYRRAHPELGKTRARELQSLLSGMVPDLGLSVLDGNKVIEVKSQVVDKGRAVTRLMLDGHFDFVFAAGDDHTDEKMFAQLPHPAHTVKIGTDETLAAWYVNDHKALRKLIDAMARADQYPTYSTISSP